MINKALEIIRKTAATAVETGVSEEAVVNGNIDVIVSLFGMNVAIRALKKWQLEKQSCAWTKPLDAIRDAAR